ncbi:carbonic anhydrase [Pluteus cervinus]|uniref:Carbonic anhydrase n=1 Tax=Pluteus cervinus TaxID=181527 RepID=A0ACD3AQ64_9AGAR|nr:carbonic anhydrase [Pluteus cervinus]
MKFLAFCCTVFSIVLVALAHPQPSPRSNNASYPELQALVKGNQKYLKKMNSQHPGLLKDLAINGQHPPFVLFHCSDSRVSDALIFSELPGNLFTAVNIANQFLEDDVASTSVVGYAVEHLHVKHVILMGHYGCGGVQAAIVPPPSNPGPADVALQTWIQPIRDVYGNSTRKEIVDFRNGAGKQLNSSSTLDLQLPAFRALVEENVKASVQRVVESQIMQEDFTSSPDTPVFIHGLVYDIETGKVFDLRVSQGPPGVQAPVVPFPIVD